jgi:hypothetical protein
LRIKEKAADEGERLPARAEGKSRKRGKPEVKFRWDEAAGETAAGQASG